MRIKLGTNQSTLINNKVNTKLNTLKSLLANKNPKLNDHYNTHENNLNTISNAITQMNIVQANTYLDILTNLNQNKNINIITINRWAEIIAYQLGYLKKYKYNGNEIKKIPKLKINYYLKIAKELSQINKNSGPFLLELLPEIIENLGIPKTTKVIQVFNMIQDEDFENEGLIDKFYAELNAGREYSYGEKRALKLKNMIEHKYLKLPLYKERIFDSNYVNSFYKHISQMKNPKKRRGFIDSTLAEIFGGKNNEGQLTNMGANSLETIIEICQRYGFENQGKKIEKSMHYRIIKKEKTEIIKINTQRIYPITNLYQTKETRKLDTVFDLNNGISNEKRKNIYKAFNLKYMIQYQNIIRKFLVIADSIGNFVGISLEDIVTNLNESENEIRNCIDDGYLKTITYDKNEIIIPTTAPWI